MSLKIKRIQLYKHFIFSKDVELFIQSTISCSILYKQLYYYNYIFACV